jgi:hypothetical protein
MQKGSDIRFGALTKNRPVPVVNTPSKSERSREDIIEILTQTAMLAGSNSMHAEAAAIVRLMDSLLPQSLKVALTRAYCQASTGAVDKACIFLREQVIPQHPESLFAKAFLNFLENISGKTNDIDDIEELLDSEKLAETQFAEQALETIEAFAGRVSKI